MFTLEMLIEQTLNEYWIKRHVSVQCLYLKPVHRSLYIYRWRKIPDPIQMSRYLWQWYDGNIRFQSLFNTVQCSVYAMHCTPTIIFILLLWIRCNNYNENETYRPYERTIWYFINFLPWLLNFLIQRLYI